VPIGVTEAILDFKMWVKKPAGVNCYFTETSPGRKFVLTVYRDYKEGLYRIKGCDLDFTVCPTGQTYLVRVKVNQKGGWVFGHAGLTDAV
jgi:hypothetical protein